MIIWAVLRDSNKIGPLAKAQQQREVEEMRVASVLAAKKAEAEIHKAEATAIEAQARVVEAQARMDEIRVNGLRQIGTAS